MTGDMCLEGDLINRVGSPPFCLRNVYIYAFRRTGKL